LRVNSVSLYHFFPGKQDLLLAVLDMYHSGLRTMLLEPAWRGVTDPIERIFALLAGYRRSVADTDCFPARANCAQEVSWSDHELDDVYVGGGSRNPAGGDGDAGAGGGAARPLPAARFPGGSLLEGHVPRRQGNR
jgi:AcrR family transcriptional regulator